VTLAGEIGHRSAVNRFRGVTYNVQERWFLARVPAFEVDTTGLTEEEQTFTTEHRWWTVADLAATADRLVPLRLVQLVRALLNDGLPTQLIDVEAWPLLRESMDGSR
jgi:hypothetical protein